MERIQTLLQAGADPNARDALGETVLHKVRRAMGGPLCSGNTCPIIERMALHFYTLALQAARCKGRQQRRR